MAAYSRLAEPGTTHGPCNKSCQDHGNCRLIRRIAETICFFCGKPIGYKTDYCRGLPCESEFIHARCRRKT